MFKVGQFVQECPKLEILSLSHNSIITITSGDVKSMSNLALLDLSYNSLYHLDKSINGLTLPLVLRLDGKLNARVND